MLTLTSMSMCMHSCTPSHSLTHCDEQLREIELTYVENDKVTILFVIDELNWRINLGKINTHTS